MRFIHLLLFLPLVSGCSYHVDRSGGGNPLAGRIDPSQIDFATVNATVFQPKCARCHGGDLVASYDSVKANLGEISRRLQLPRGDGDAMPPTGPLDNADLQIYLAWVQNGAPLQASPQKNGSPPAPAPAPAPPPLPPVDNGGANGVTTFAEVQSKVFQPRCVQCHSKMFSSYEKVKPHLPKIDQFISAGIMPPSSAPSLTEEEKQLVLRWIASGAPASITATEN